MVYAIMSGVFCNSGPHGPWFITHLWDKDFELGIDSSTLTAKIWNAVVYKELDYTF